MQIKQVFMLNVDISVDVCLDFQETSEAPAEKDMEKISHQYTIDFPLLHYDAHNLGCLFL